MSTTTNIIDIFHQNAINFQKVQDDGIIAIIHKASEGARFTDSEYQDRKAKAKGMGFLWGAYHFSSADNVTSQVDNFLTQADADDTDLLALDYEPSSHGANMTLAQAREFVEMVHDRVGRYPVIYGGSLLRENLGNNTDSVLANCPLWYARYAPRPLAFPVHTFPVVTLWQYTDGNDGDAGPQKVAGIGRCDRNIFFGSDDDLRAAWPLTEKTAAPFNAETAFAAFAAPKGHKRPAKRAAKGRKH